MKKNIDKIGPTFCLAKWYRTNLRLDIGKTYSCHHCLAHSIDKDQIKKDPSKLTNTDYIIEKRQEMMNGERPSECNYCWTAEDNGNVSDRYIKSSGIEYFNELQGRDVLTEASTNLSVVPSQLEISLDNTCNLKCSYCGPAYSSKWEEEISQYGPYPTKTKRITESGKILNREHNPYIEAFWKWWPELKENLQTLRITGGEPLLSKNTYKLMDMMILDNPKFNFAINSNLSVDISRLLDRLTNHPEVFKNFILYTSIESEKNRNEYSRFGLDYNLLTDNVEKYLSTTNGNLTFMCTVNILSISGFDKFLDYFIELQNNYGNRVSFVSTFLRAPAYLDMRILPDKNKNEIKEKILGYKDKLPQAEYRTVERTIDYMSMDIDKLEVLRSDFVKFILEYDRRRKTNFFETYPEYVDFFNEWNVND